jgi:cob(I)alamin adenosyltransferase
MTNSPATPLDGQVDETIADLALAEREAETNQLRELLTLIDGTLREVGNTNICSSAVVADHLLDMRNLLSGVLDGRVA